MMLAGAMIMNNDPEIMEENAFMVCHNMFLM
jgi:hypothetical protein